MFKRLVALVVSLALVSCTSKTVFRSSDPGVEIFVDGIPKGKGNVIYSDQKVSGTNRIVRLEKRGCASDQHTISRRGQLNIAALIGGILLIFPFLWIVDYEPEYYFQYKCIPAES